MRRFLLHVLPSRFHRIRHYELLANASRKANIAQARQLLHPPSRATSPRRTRHIALWARFIAASTALGAIGSTVTTLASASPASAPTVYSPYACSLPDAGLGWVRGFVP